MRVSVVISLVLLACIAVPGRVVADDEEFTIAERIELPAAYRAGSAALVATPGDGAAVRGPARLLVDGEAVWLIGRLAIPAAGDYRLTATIRAEGQPDLEHLIDERRRFELERYDVCLVIDASHSMRDNDPDDLRAAAIRRFAELARDSRTVARLSLVVFRSDAKVRVPLTPVAELQDMADVRRHIRPGGATDFDAAFEKTIDALGAETTHKRAVIFLSDGDHTGRYLGGHQAVAERGWPVYTIGLSPDADAGALQQIARDTKGQFFDAPKADDLTQVFEKIFHLIDRPRSLVRRNLDLSVERELALRADPTMRHPTLHLVSVQGATRIRLGDKEMEIAEGGEQTVPIAPNAVTQLRAAGDGKLAVDLRADTDLVLEAMAFDRDADASVPLRAVAWLSGSSRRWVEDLTITMQIDRPGRTPQPLAVGAVDVYEATLAVEAAGSYPLRIEARGTVDGAPFERVVLLNATRTGRAMAQGGGGGPLLTERGPVETTAVGPRDLTTERTLLPTLDAGTLTTFQASPATLTVATLWPGVSTETGVDVSIEGVPAQTDIRARIDGTPPHVTLSLAGDIRAGNRSRLTLTATSAVGATSAAWDATIVVEAAAKRWTIPVSGQIGEPRIALTFNELESIVDPETPMVSVSQEMILRLEPDGRVPLQITTDVPGLTLSAATVPGGPTPQRVELALVAERSSEAREVAGTIVVDGLGLAPVTVPFRLQLDPLPPEPEAVVPVVQESLPQAVAGWRSLLWLLVILALILLIWAISQGRRRMIYVGGSILIHVLAFLLIVPKPEVKESEKRESGPLVVTTGGVIVEEVVAAEVATFENAAADAAQAAEQAKTDAELPDAETQDEAAAVEVTDALPTDQPAPEAAIPETEPTEREAMEPEQLPTEVATPEARRAEAEATKAQAREAAAEMAATQAEAMTQTATMTVTPGTLAPSAPATDAAAKEAAEALARAELTPSAEVGPAVEAGERRAEDGTAPGQGRDAQAGDSAPVATGTAGAPAADGASRATVALGDVVVDGGGSVAGEVRAVETTVARGTMAPAALAPTAEAGPGRRADAPNSDAGGGPVGDAATPVSAGDAAAAPAASESGRATVAVGEAAAQSASGVSGEARAIDATVARAAMAPSALAPTADAGTAKRADGPAAAATGSGPLGASTSAPVAAGGGAAATVSAKPVALNPVGGGAPAAIAPTGAGQPGIAAPQPSLAAGELAVDLTPATGRHAAPGTPTSATDARAGTAPTGPVVAASPGDPQARVGARAVAVDGNVGRGESPTVAPHARGGVSRPARPSAALRDLGGTPGTPAPGRVATPASAATSAGPLATRTGPASVAAAPRDTVADIQPRALAPAAPTAAQAAGLTDVDVRRPPSITMNAGAGDRPRGAWANTLPVARYTGDWDCDATAMLNLAHQLERRTGSLLPLDSRTVGLDDPELQQTPFVFMTGHDPFTFTAPEVKNLATYLGAGGYIWINDSTDLGDDRYDAAVRRELARVLPGAQWRKIPMDSTLFSGPYDLRKGYLGYRIPPGDKYRLDYLEGLWIGDRLAVIYTRNDYGDGLEIDPHTHPLMSSLSDLSPAEMQEGSIRMGVNIVNFFMNDGKPPAPGTVAAMPAAPTDAERSRAAIGDRKPVTDALTAAAQTWEPTVGWDDLLPADIQRGDDGSLAVTISGEGAVNRRQKVIVHTAPNMQLTSSQALVLDVQSGMRGGCRLAVAFTAADGSGYLESAPVFVKPGENRGLVIDLAHQAFKSAATEWRYEAPFPATMSAGTMFLIVYPQETAGQITIRQITVVAPAAE